MCTQNSHLNFNSTHCGTGESCNIRSFEGKGFAFGQKSGSNRRSPPCTHGSDGSVNFLPFFRIYVLSQFSLLLSRQDSLLTGCLALDHGKLYLYWKKPIEIFIGSSKWHFSNIYICRPKFAYFRQNFTPFKSTKDSHGKILFCFNR